jgi:hypothetical protein
MKLAIEIFTKSKIDLTDLKMNVLKVANYNFNRNKLALNFLEKLYEV